MESIVLLDVDGVINSTENIQTRHFEGKSTLASEIEIPKEMLLRVKRIVEETNSYLVISSTWRKFSADMENLSKQLKTVGVGVYGSTPYLGGDRGEEILSYLRNNNFMGIPYVVIDDDSFDIEKYIPADNFIHTSGYIGLTDEQVENAIKSLNNQRSILLGNISAPEKKNYATKDESETAYSVYINSHINAVIYVYKRYIYDIIKWLVGKYPDEALEWDKAFQFMNNKIKEHDKSKFSNEEFEAYRIKFFKSDEDKDDETDFDNAWKHHYKHNSHHPEFWVVNLDKEPKERKFVEMNKSSFLEMLCDWIAMSFNRNQSLYNWWLNEASGRAEKKDLMASNTLTLVDEFITANKDTFDFSSK